MACIDFSELAPGATVTRYDDGMFDGVETAIAVTRKSKMQAAGSSSVSLVCGRLVASLHG